MKECIASPLWVRRSCCKFFGWPSVTLVGNLHLGPCDIKNRHSLACFSRDFGCCVYWMTLDFIPNTGWSFSTLEWDLRITCFARNTYIFIHIYIYIFRISQYTGNQPNKNQGEIFSDLDLNWKFHAHNFHSTVIPNEAPHVELRHQKRDGTENLCGPLLAHCLTVLARKLELHSKLLVVSGFFEGLFENRSLHEKEKKHLTFPYQVCSDAMPCMFLQSSLHA